MPQPLKSKYISWFALFWESVLKTMFLVSDLIANSNENTLLTDSFGESPEVPATPPPTAINPTGNNRFLSCFFFIVLPFFHFVLSPF